ncbi:MAG: sigma 54-interacting transcriptional regulator [Candidatus Krumholzibacteriia bacterium]
MDKGPQPSRTADGRPFLESLSAERFEAVLGSISDGVFTIDLDGRITCFNRAAQEITGYSRDEALGRPCREILRSNICHGACALRYTMETNKPVVDLLVQIRNRQGDEIPVSISTALFRDTSGAVVGGVETFRDLRQVEVLRKRLEETYSYRDIVGKSDGVRKVLEILPTIAESDSTILVTGESGTGKELVARAIHDLSTRATGPFVPVNSGGIPDTLIEAELFGYEPGAFTGAVRSKPGRVARAENGTLFLDEIGDLASHLQAKLLRFLQERCYEPLGGVRSRRANVRIVAATNHELGKMVEEGTFRSDLYYRLNVFRIRIPPLRERRGDLPLLIAHFVQELRAERGKRVVGFTPAALKILMAYDYPGNVRELRNAVEHGFVLASGPLIEVEHLPGWLAPETASSPEPSSLAELERQFILSVLQKNAGNRNATARELGIHKTTLYRRIRRLGIQLPGQDRRP